LAGERVQTLSRQNGSSNVAKKSDVPASLGQSADSSRNSDELSAQDVNVTNEITLEPDKAEAKDKVTRGGRNLPFSVAPKPAERRASASPAPSAPPPTASAQVSNESAGVTVSTTQQQEMSGMSRFTQNGELRLANSVGEVAISAPGGQVSWRAGQAGIIQFSSDAGKSWTLQPSGVVSDLLAGSASSDKVCWIAGRNGTVLRTTDAGAHWQKLHSPSQEDLHSVFAVDARQATVSSATGKYQTTDGGITWKKLPAE
jgi:photosystem II stability/assembly factor-like uncharacterized protein